MSSQYFGRPLEMNPEVRAMWIAALLSRAYKQGKQALHSILYRGEVKTGDRWCCLGVLCDLAVKAGVKLEVHGESFVTYDREHAYLPHAVMEWAGLDSRNPWVYGASLSAHNDGSAWTNARRFTTIAAMIGGTYKGRL